MTIRNRWLALVLAALMLFGLSVQAQEETAPGLRLAYPEFMQEKMGEALVLDRFPERIVALNFSAVQVLDYTDIRPVAVGAGYMNVSLPEWASELPQIAVRKDALDIEAIVALEPDLLIMGSHLEEKYSEQLDATGIPVYYVAEGPIITYDETKATVLAFAEAFGGAMLHERISQEYQAVEDKIAYFNEGRERSKAMILFAVPPKFQQSSEGYFGSMLQKLPFDNLADELVGSKVRISPFDYEVLIREQPEYLFCLSPSVPTPEAMEEAYAKVFEDNKEVWEQVEAYQKGKIIYLSNEFVTTKGLQSVQSLNKLLDQVRALLGEDERPEGLEIPYPEKMQEGLGESLKLEQFPERIVALDFSANQVLDYTGIRPVAVGQTYMNVQVPAWTKELPSIQAGMRGLDIEGIVALEPDLLIMGVHLKEKYSEQLEATGIPTYYVSVGPITTYEETKETVMAFAEAFGGERLMQAIEKRYQRVDEKVTAYAEGKDAKRAMILFAVPPKFQQSSEGYFGSMLKSLPFTNLADELVGPKVRISPFDYEVLIREQPEYLFLLSPTMSMEADMEAAYAKEIADNQAVWDQIEAYKNGKMIYLSSEYVTTKGLQSVDSLGRLLLRIEALLEETE